MKNLNGFVGLISILIVTLVIALWFAYIWKKQWFTGANLNPLRANEPQNKPVTEQLDDLRTDLNSITQKKDKEIQDAMGEEGKAASEMLNTPK